MPVWLVTGGSGFIGRTVLDMLIQASAGEFDLLALGRRCPSGWPARQFVTADLEQPGTVAQAIHAVRPSVVIHAAGRTPPGDPELFYRANTLATLNLLDALRADHRPIRVVIAGSAAELGPVPEEHLPVNESYRCLPADAYGLSKLLATCAGLAARAPLEVLVARVFNPIGPGQPLNQAFGRFAAWLSEPHQGPMIVGDLESRRDFIDVRDVARALIALAFRGEPGRIYHVGTGGSHAVGEGLDHLIARSGRVVEVQVDPGLVGPRGPRDSRADIRRITSTTGWRPEISLERSLNDLWDEVAPRQRLPLTA